LWERTLCATQTIGAHLRRVIAYWARDCSEVVALMNRAAMLQCIAL